MSANGESWLLSGCSAVEARLAGRCAFPVVLVKP